jgi:hypothetical protein
MVRLAAGERLSDAHDLVDRFSEVIGHRVLHVPGDAQLRDRPRSLLHVLVEAPAPLPKLAFERAKRFNAIADRAYYAHSHQWMDWCRSTLSVRVRDAIQMWRSRYGITEEDQALWTAEKAYYRYRQKRLTLYKHGGARYGTRQR